MKSLESFWMKSSQLSDGIYIPKYYDRKIEAELAALEGSHDLLRIGDLVRDGVLSLGTGHEVGKDSYGTGDIPFVRTSDIANFELKTSPKQGISEKIYKMFAARQDVAVGDILFVRDGTYLIGRSAMVTEADGRFLFQSHVLKIRVNQRDVFEPELLFVLLNAPIVQSQIRAKQFTADTIDTIGNRFSELILPVPRDTGVVEQLTMRARRALETRSRGRMTIQHMPTLIEEAILDGQPGAVARYGALSESERLGQLRQRAVTSEFGVFNFRWIAKSALREGILLPKYYDPTISEELKTLSETCNLVSIGSLVEDGTLEVGTGDEPGKASYGTGGIPFLRTSDFTNWEVAADPKQGISEAIYDSYAAKQSLQDGDILLVRDGTYLVGSSCLVTSVDARARFSGGLVRLRADSRRLSPYLLLALMNSFIVKRQFRSKQFTRDVIDTLGQRYREVILPIPKSDALRDEIAEAVMSALLSRIRAREELKFCGESITTDTEQM